MARPKVTNDSLLVVLTGRVGFRKAMKVCVFIIAWGIAYENLGSPPKSVEEYAAWWKESVPTAYREQKLFREALPSETTPTRIWELVRAEIDLDDKAAPARLANLSAGKLRLA